MSESFALAMAPRCPSHNEAACLRLLCPQHPPSRNKGPAARIDDADCLLFCHCVTPPSVLTTPPPAVLLFVYLLLMYERPSPLNRTLSSYGQQNCQAGGRQTQHNQKRKWEIRAVLQHTACGSPSSACCTGMWPHVHCRAPKAGQLVHEAARPQHTHPRSMQWRSPSCHQLCTHTHPLELRIMVPPNTMCAGVLSAAFSAATRVASS